MYHYNFWELYFIKLPKAVNRSICKNCVLDLEQSAKKRIDDWNINCSWSNLIIIRTRSNMHRVLIWFTYKWNLEASTELANKFSAEHMTEKVLQKNPEWKSMAPSQCYVTTESSTLSYAYPSCIKHNAMASTIILIIQSCLVTCITPQPIKKKKEQTISIENIFQAAVFL